MSKKNTIPDQPTIVQQVIHNDKVYNNGFQQAEYSALKFEQRNRYEALNKLNSGFITFTTAVLTIGFGLMAVNYTLGKSLLENAAAIEANGYSDNLNTLIEQHSYNIELAALALQFFQAILFLTPIIYSKICFNHALENNVRISLITDYLSYKNKDIKNWDKVRHSHSSYETTILPYFFGAFCSKTNSKRVGDLSNMHRIISALSFLLGIGYGIIVFYNCVYNITKISDEKDIYQTLGIHFAIIMGAALILHLLLIIFFLMSEKLKHIFTEARQMKYEHKSVAKFLYKVTFKVIKNTKLGLYKPYNQSACKRKKLINTILMWCSIALVIKLSISQWYAVSLIQKTDFNIVMATAKIVISTIFSSFVLLCIWQIPGYSLECILSDSRVEHNENALKIIMKD